MTALHAAIESGVPGSVELLLDFTASVDGTALIKAVKNGNVEIVRLLGEYGARLGSDDKSLIYCVREGLVDAVPLLLKAGINVHLQDKEVSGLKH